MGEDDPARSRPLPPAYGTGITQPAPTPRPVPVPPQPWTGPSGVPMPALVTLDGTVVPAPSDGVVHAAPPKVPAPRAASVPARPPAKPPAATAASHLDALVDKKYAGAPPADLVAAPLAALKGLSAAKARALADALNVHTIGDLARHPFIQAAVTMTDAS